MKNKNILVIATKAITINIFLKEIINELNYFKKVIIGSSNIKDIKRLNNKKILLHFPLTIFQLFNPFYVIYCIIQNRKIIKLNNINYILLNTPLASHIIRISCILLNIKIIYFVHGYRFHPNGNFFLNLIFYCIEKILSFKTDAFININKTDYKITNKYFKKKTLLVNGVGINLKIKKNSFINFKNKDNFIIGFIAAYKKNKGYEDLIKLCKMIEDNQNIQFQCYGYGSKKNYENKIKSLKLTNIKLNKFNSNILDKIQNFDVLLSLSHREGLPVSFLECMSQGVPVISYKIRGAKDLIIDNYNGYLYEKKNIKKILEKIIFLSKNNNILSQISNNSYKFIDHKFDSTKNAKIIVKFINNV